MRDLRDMTPPADATVSLYETGDTVQSSINSQVWHVFYSRPLWKGEYNWEQGDNFQEVLAHFSNPDNQYIIPIYEKEGTYTGAGTDWTNTSENIWAFSGRGQDFQLGEYIQLDRYCCRIIEKNAQHYRLYPHPPATSFVTATNERFFIHGQRVNLLDNEYTIYRKRRVGEFAFIWQEMP